MPTPVKLNPKTSPAPKVSGVLGRIVPVSSQEGGLKIVVYGRGKTGKTSFACTFPKPLLLIGTEDGTRSVSNVKGVEFVMLYEADDLGELVGQVQAQGKYSTLVLDTAGGYQDLILKGVLGLDEVPVSKYRQASKGEAWGITDKGTWGTIGTQFKERMRSFLNLAQSPGLHTVVIAHERSFGDDDSQSNLIFPTIGPALTPSASGWLNGACDYICQTFLRERTEERIHEVQGKKISQKVKTGEVEYCLRTGPHPVFMTGFRVPRGVVVPADIPDPCYDKVLAAIRGSQAK